MTSLARPRAVVVVAYRSSTLLAAALVGLDASEQVVVVDNSSDADVCAVAESAGAQYVDSGRNAGFAAGVNIALRLLREAGHDGDVLLLNPDARLTSAALDRLEAVFDKPGNERVGAVSPALAAPDGHRQRVTWPFPTPGAMWLEAFGLARFRSSTDRFVVGAALLLRREALAEVGQFDERYFLYAEETDWQRRALERGWTSLEAPDVEAVHIGSGTSEDETRRERYFHAGQETYIRRWFGADGWQSYRAAALTAALLRSVAARGDAKAAARRRVRLYLRGPRSVADLPAPSPALRVTHLVVTDHSAGTERYVAAVANRQAASGHQVTVIGGAGDFMASTLDPRVTWRAGSTPRAALRALHASRRTDVVHTHLTAADLVALLWGSPRRVRLVATRHIAKPRGSSGAVSAVARLAQRRFDQEISISEHVASTIGVPSVVLHNGVPTRPEVAALSSRTVLVAHRLEREKDTETALRGWALSGLAERGWTLVVCGSGAEAEPLRALVEQLEITGVQWRGWVPDTREVMVNSGVLLASALSEPFGLTVIEAMSVGLPVIASAAGGHLETVGVEHRELLYTPGDAKDLARVLVDFAELPEQRRRELGARLQAQQRRDFDLDRHVERLTELYRGAS